MVVVVVLAVCLGGIAMGLALGFGADQLIRFIGREILDAFGGD